MDYTKLGGTGLEVSRICLGCMTFGVPDRGAHTWTLDDEKSRPIIKRALELGVNFFDTANVYSDGTSEEIVGRALKALREARRGRDRDEGLGPDAPRPERAGPVAGRHHDGDRQQFKAARRRPRRPLSDSSQRPDHADRGDHGSAPRRREGGQGPLHRSQQHGRMAVRPRALRRRPAWLDAFRDDAGSS